MDDITQTLHTLSIHPSTPSRLRPSDIGGFFTMNCETYLRRQAAAAADSSQQKSERPADQRARMRRGDEWEDALLKSTQRRSLDVPAPTVPADMDPRAQERLMMDALQRIRPSTDAGLFMHHLIAHLPPSLAPRLPPNVSLSRYEPDFLHIVPRSSRPSMSSLSSPDPQFLVIVIDAKASSHMKLSHQVQVALYARALQHALDSCAITSHGISDHGAVWLPGLSDSHTTMKYEVFPLSQVLTLVDDFLDQRLPSIMAKDEPSWQLSPICAHCPHIGHCRSKATTERPISALPYLSRHDSRWLAQLVSQNQTASGGGGGAGSDIEDLAAMLAPDGALRQDSLPASVKRNLRRLLALRVSGGSPVTDAFIHNRPFPRGMTSLALPRAEDATLSLVLLTDPGSGRLWGWAVHGTRGQEQIISTSGCSKWPATHNSLLATQTAFLVALDSALTSLASSQLASTPSASALTCKRCLAGKGCRWRGMAGHCQKPVVASGAPDRPRVQCYVWESSENALLKSVLLDASCHDDTLGPKWMPEAYDDGADAVDDDKMSNWLRAQRALLALVDDAEIVLSPAPPISGPEMPQHSTALDKLSETAAAAWLHALGVEDKDGVSQLREELARRAAGDDAVAPRVISLVSAVSHLLSLPVPGFYTVNDVAKWLGVKEQSLEAAEIYSLWITGKSLESVHAALLHRAVHGLNIARGLREFLGRESEKPLDDLLPAVAPRLCLLPPPRFHTSAIRKLVFMLQYEAVSSLSRLRQERASGGGRECILRFAGIRELASKKGGPMKKVPEFELEEGDMPEADDYIILTYPRRLRRRLLCRLPDSPAESPSYIHFVDSAHLATAELQDGSAARAKHQMCFAEVNTVIPGRDLTGQPLDHPRTRVHLDTDFGARRCWSIMGLNAEGVGGRYSLRERYTADGLVLKAVGRLLEIDADADNDPLFLRLVTQGPHVWGSLPPATNAKTGVSLAAFVKAARRATTHWGEMLRLHGEIAQPLVMARSQAAVFLPAQGGIMGRRLQLVWGPPGTGKTHFMGLSILRMIEAMSRVSAEDDVPHPFRVAVLAFTNSAVLTLLQRVSDLLGLAGKLGPEACTHIAGAAVLRCGKKGALETIRPGAKSARRGELPQFCVVGGTCWKMLDHTDDWDGEFDLLIVDEASQMRTSDFAIASHVLNPDSGRLVVVGDHMQMPPIVNAPWPQSPASGPHLFGSLMECLAGQGALEPGSHPTASDQIAMLQENWRMNGPLCAFTGRLYGATYQPLEAARRQHLPLNLALLGEPATDAMTAAHSILHSTFDKAHPNPLIALRLHGLRGAGPTTCTLGGWPPGHPDEHERMGWENAAGSVTSEAVVASEAKLVAALMFSVLQGLHGSWHPPPDLPPVKSAKSYRPPPPTPVFAVTPHRAQRAAVTAALVALGGNAALEALGSHATVDECVDTVERMQGREVEVVFVCYGMLEDAKIDRESRFLFDVRRLNVALSRARRLCVLVVGEPIVQPRGSTVTDPLARMAVSHLSAYLAGADCIRVGVHLDHP